MLVKLAVVAPEPRLHRTDIVGYSKKKLNSHPVASSFCIAVGSSSIQRRSTMNNNGRDSSGGSEASNSILPPISGTRHWMGGTPIQYNTGISLKSHLNTWPTLATSFFEAARLPLQRTAGILTTILSRNVIKSRQQVECRCNDSNQTSNESKGGPLVECAIWTHLLLHTAV